MRRLRRVTALFLAAAAMPAAAGLFDDDEARRRIEDFRAKTETRLEKLESGNARAQLELNNQIEALRGELAGLRGQIEVLTHDVLAAQKRQQDFYIDLDSRLRKLESAAAESAKAPGPAQPAADPAAEMRDYEAALAQFRAAKYKEAVPAFQAFIKAYPAGAFAANAHYWLGASHYQSRDYTAARDMFLKVVTTWPADPKAADAMLGIANCQQATGDGKGARQTMETLVAKHPDSQAATLARDRLKKK